MKVTVKNPNKKPINISKLAPLMPTQVLSVNEEIEVNVRDIEGVMKRAEEIGVTVTPMEAFETTPVVDDPDGLKNPESITETSNNEKDGSKEVPPEIGEDAQETNKVDEGIKDIDEKPKSKFVGKSAKGKKTTTKKSIFGNNK